MISLQVSEDVSSVPGSPGSTQEGKDEGKPKEVFDDPTVYDENLTEQSHHVIVPSYSSWFDYNRYELMHVRP